MSTNKDFYTGHFCPLPPENTSRPSQSIYLDIFHLMPWSARCVLLGTEVWRELKTWHQVPSYAISPIFTSIYRMPTSQKGTCTSAQCEIKCRLSGFVQEAVRIVLTYILDIVSTLRTARKPQLIHTHAGIFMGLRFQKICSRSAPTLLDLTKHVEKHTSDRTIELISSRLLPADMYAADLR